MQALTGAGPYIVSRTPLRVGLAGGGTDLRAYYSTGYGQVFSTAINQYVYVTVKRHSRLFAGRPGGPSIGGAIRVNYSKGEEVDSVDEIENDIVRECLRFLDIGPPIYISTIGDVPASTGLGGSSSFCVGLMNALHAFLGERIGPGQLADEACHVEIDVLGNPIGKQDQYAAAFGGVNVYQFKKDGNVSVDHVRMSSDERRELESCMLMFWTGHQRDASSVLVVQAKNTPNEWDRLTRMRDQVSEMRAMFGNGCFRTSELGALLHRGWMEKRRLAPGIATSEIDEWYQRGMSAGAYGGRLCGAGGGGFLLFIAPPDRHEAIRMALKPLMELPVRIEHRGTTLIEPFHG